MRESLKATLTRALISAFILFGFLYVPKLLFVRSFIVTFFVVVVVVDATAVLLLSMILLLSLLFVAKRTRLYIYFFLL